MAYPPSALPATLSSSQAGSTPQTLTAQPQSQPALPTSGASPGASPARSQPTISSDSGTRSLQMTAALSQFQAPPVAWPGTTTGTTARGATSSVTTAGTTSSLPTTSTTSSLTTGGATSERASADTPGATGGGDGQLLSPRSGRALPKLPDTVPNRALPTPPASPASPRGNRSDAQDPWKDASVSRLPRRISRRFSGKFSGSGAQAGAAPAAVAQPPAMLPLTGATTVKARSPVPVLNLGLLSVQSLPGNRADATGLSQASPGGPPPLAASVCVTQADAPASPRSPVDVLGGRPRPPGGLPPSASTFPPLSLPPGSPRGASLGANLSEQDSPKKPSPGREGKPVFVYLGSSRPAPQPVTPSKFVYDPKAVPKPRSAALDQDPIGPVVSPLRVVLPPLSADMLPSGLEDGLRPVAWATPRGASLPPGMPSPASALPPPPDDLPPALPPNSPRGYVYTDYPARVKAEQDAASKAQPRASISPSSMGSISLSPRPGTLGSGAPANGNAAVTNASGALISPRSKSKTQPGAFVLGLAKSLWDTASQIKVSGSIGNTSAGNTSTGSPTGSVSAITTSGTNSATTSATHGSVTTASLRTTANVTTTTTSTSTTAHSTLTTTSDPSSAGVTSTLGGASTKSAASPSAITATASHTSATSATTVAFDDPTGRMRADTTGVRSKRSQENVRSTMKMVKSESLPEWLTAPQEMAQKFARAESSNFATVAVGRANPVYRDNFTGASESLYYRRQWRPFLMVISRDLQRPFTLADNFASDSAAWKRLIAKCDMEAGERGMSARDLNKIPEVRKMAEQLLKPILDTVNGDGESLLTSVLPPAMLHFLLELDFQHTSNWNPRSQRLLEQQILRMESDELFEQIRKPNSRDQQTAIAQQLELSMEKAAEYKAARMKEGEDGLAELAALDKLTAPGMARGAENIRQKRELLARHDADFRQIRHQAMQAFIGIRGLCSLYNYRHESIDRPLVALSGMLAYLLSELPLLDRLLDCGDQERAQVAARSIEAMGPLQLRWRAEVATDKNRKRTELMLERLQRSHSENPGTVSKKQIKSKSRKAMAAEAPLFNAGPETRPARPKRGSQPNMLQKPAGAEERLNRRQKTIAGFLETQGINRLIQAQPGSRHGILLGGLADYLTEHARTAKRVNEDVISKLVIGKLTTEIQSWSPTSDSRRAIERLLSDLEAKAADDSAAKDSPHVSRKLEEKEKEKGD